MLFFNHLLVKSLSIHSFSTNHSNPNNWKNWDFLIMKNLIIPLCSEGGGFGRSNRKVASLDFVMIFTHPSAVSKSQDALEINLVA